MESIQKQVEKEKIILKQCEAFIELFYPHTYTAACKPYSKYDAIKCAQKCAIQLRVHASENVTHMGRLGMNDFEYWTRCIDTLGKMIVNMGGTITTKND